MLRLTLRTVLARKVRLLMSGLSIVLGVAFLAGVLVFSNGLSATFDGIVDGSTPDAVVRPAGSQQGDTDYAGRSDASLTPAVVRDLAALPEVARADGDVTGFGLSLLASDGTLVGGTGAPTLAFNHHDGPAMTGDAPLTLTAGRWPQGTDELVLDVAAARNGDYRLGDTVRLLTPFGTTERRARLVGTAEFTAGGTAGATLVVLSTEGARALFLGGAETFTGVSLTAAPGVDEAALVRAADRVLPDGFEAVRGSVVAQESADAFGTFLGVISTFLLVFAIIAVLVGGFIIVNTFSILVAQRTRELALLRALGASRSQVTRSGLAEASVLAVVTSTVGIVGGLLLARGLAGVFRTFGLDIASDQLVLTRATVVTSFVVGIGVTLAAAYLPARRGARTAPVAAMRPDTDLATSRSLRRRGLVGAVAAAVGAGLAVAGVRGAPGSDAAWVGGGAVIWILTATATSPLLGRPLLLGARTVLARLAGTPGRLAAENALRDPRRTGATASALMIGLALVSTIGVLASSLTASVDDLVDEQFSSDLLVQTSTFRPFTTEVGDRVAAVPGVREISREQRAEARVGAADGRSVDIAATDAAYDGIYRQEVVSGRQEVRGREAVLFARLGRELGVGVGDPLVLAFPGGRTVTLTVVGLVRASEASEEVRIPLDTLAAAGIVRQDTAVSVMVRRAADLDTVRDAVDEAASVVPTVGVFDKESFSQQIRDRINQLLYLIYGLLTLAIVIAVIGIVNTLGLSVIERTREIGLLRALGMRRGALARMITLESIAIAVLGAVLGMALGLLSGVLLQRALADDLTSLGLPLGQLGIFLVLSVVVGVAAAVLPAVRAARLDVLRAISTE